MSDNQPNEPHDTPRRSRFSRRQLFKYAGLSAGGVALAGTATFGYARQIEPGWLEMTQVSLTLPRLSPAFHGYRIAQISDIHMDNWMTLDRLIGIVKAINAQQVDLIALTGDYVTYDAEQFAPDLVTGFRQLHAPDGVVATLGNHDHWTDADVLYEVIHDAGLIDLNNAVHTLTRDGQHFHIAGLDDIWEKKHRLDLVLPKLQDSSAAMLLAHEPDFADVSAATGRFDLQISGHSHGGQVTLPLFGPIEKVYLGEKYVSGRYQVGTMIQYTNRGVGMLSPHFRFNCRPEITIYTLKAGNL